MNDPATLTITIELPADHPIHRAPTLVVGNDYGEVVVERDEAGRFFLTEDRWEVDGDGRETMRLPRNFYDGFEDGGEE